jgi:hypothetical protein
MHNKTALKYTNLKKVYRWHKPKRLPQLAETRWSERDVKRTHLMRMGDVDHGDRI